MFLNRRHILLPGSLCPAILCLFATNLLQAEESSRAAIVERVRSDVQYLASDELEGRGIETAGIEKAAQHIEAEYRRLGLQAPMPGDSYRQRFSVTLGDVSVTKATKVTLNGPGGLQVNLARGSQYQPLRRGADGDAEAEIVFLGYGITAPDENYDDYADVDVKGKIVVLIRREPQQDREDGAFRGKETSEHSYIDTKLNLIARSGAAAVLFVNDCVTAPSDARDELSTPVGFGTNGSGVPFVHVKQSVINTLLSSSPLQVGDDQKLSSLSAVCQQIDETMQPVSQLIEGWTAAISVGFETNSVETDNIIGVIEGEGPLADETIVIGGHYDHLGYGGYGSRARNRTGEIHNGADDNATGTAAVLETARRIAAGPKPKRRMVFICFSGEERGLIGSQHYVRHPVFPLAQTVAMLNFDMIGNLRNNRVEVNGVGTAEEFEAIVDAADAVVPVDITVVPHPFGGSDHLPFYQRQIPVMFCFTGMTQIYHTPDDDFETLNIEGVVSVIDYNEQLLRGIDALPQRPTYSPVSRTGSRRPSRTPYLGFAPDLDATDSEGVRVRDVRDDSPAKAAGIVTGDVITAINEEPVADFTALTERLTAAKAGDEWSLSVTRGDESLTLKVKLGQPK